ncbi:hypothetical protein GCM10022255_083650 [Dactylosporangium darangshiense]|uniref:Uncharacterized protein n=2 Tax=Dactylosporangium darangshiense TaxID=579108 RepID=A0ABP8DMC7_9ACTN
MHETPPSPDLLRAALAEPFPVPAAAAFAFARAGLPMSADDLHTVAAAYEHGEPWRGPWDDDVKSDPWGLARLLDVDSVATLTDAAPPAFDRDALAMVRRRLTAHCATGSERRSTKFSDPGAAAPIHLIQLLHRRGPAAADGVPEIVAAYELASGVAAGALAAIGPAALSAVPALHDRAARGDIRAAHAIWRLTGDAAPLLGAVTTYGSRRRRGLAWDFRLAAEAGQDLAPLVPQLRAWSADPTIADAADRVALAEMLWRATDDPVEALPTVSDVLDGNPARRRRGRPPRRVPATRRHRPRPRPVAPAHRRQPMEQAGRGAALWRLGTPVQDLVTPILTAIAQSDQPDAMTLLVDMHAVAAVPDLVALAERDERVVRNGTTTNYGSDMSWRDALRDER